MITRRAGHLWEICGRPEDREKRRWLEAHERWAYYEHTGVQTLRRLICCSDCHLTTHMGYANIAGRTDHAMTDLRVVTGMTVAQADAHITTAGRLWATRSRRTWTLDLAILTRAGVTLARPDDPTTRHNAVMIKLGARTGAAGWRS